MGRPKEEDTPFERRPLVGGKGETRSPPCLRTILLSFPMTSTGNFRWDSQASVEKKKKLIPFWRKPVFGGKGEDEGARDGSQQGDGRDKRLDDTSQDSSDDWVMNDPEVGLPTDKVRFRLSSHTTPLCL